MKKYVEVFKSSLKEMLEYRFDVFSGAIFSIFSIVIAFFMWRVIFENETVVAGYTFNMMMTYYIIVNFMTMMDGSSKVSKRLAGEIKNGHFTKYIVKPISPLKYYFAVIMSKGVYIFLFNVITTILWIVILSDYFIVVNNLSIIFYAVTIFILGSVFLALLNYFFTILTFWILEVTAFFMIKDNIVLLVSGSLVPLQILPIGFVSVLKYTPFYYLYYYPASLYVTQNLNGIGLAYLVLSLSIVFLLIVNTLLYKKATDSYEGVGV